MSNVSRIEDLKTLPSAFLTSIYEDMKQEEISTLYNAGPDGVKRSLSYLERKLHSRTFEAFFVYQPNVENCRHLSCHDSDESLRHSKAAEFLFCSGRIAALLFDKNLMQNMCSIYLNTREVQTVINCLNFFKSQADLFIHYNQRELLVGLTLTLLDFFQPILSFK